VLSLLIGLLIDSLPYIFLPLMWLFPSVGVSWFLAPFALLFMLWPLVLIGQCVTALYFLFVARPRRRLLAIGILLMLALIYLAIHFGWLSSASSLLN
jgi:hypothetical protein